MRNLLGRLHARRLPELLRIADAWGVPLHGESKGEVVGALYRAMSDPRTMRDVWDRLDPAERAMTAALADAPDGQATPTLIELAARLGVGEVAARETALRLFRAGILAREGDDEPLPIGTAPRLHVPREIALTVRRLQDEMAAGDLAQAPLRVLIELLDDAELESAARTWGLRTVPGVAPRGELATRLLRLVNDASRVERVVRGRGHDAAAIWKAVRATGGAAPLPDVAAKAGLAGRDTATVARLRAALTELEGSLLVWHAYRRDGSRWLFVPPEIRNPGEKSVTDRMPLQTTSATEETLRPWRHPDALAWDLLTLLRIVADPQAPAWDASEPPPRWLRRVAASRLWIREPEGPPTGYLELLLALALAEGLLTVEEETSPRRFVVGSLAKAWRGVSFAEQTTRLRERWLRLPRWVEGEPAGLVDVWGADWRGTRPRLLTALGDADTGLVPGQWVTLESLAARLAASQPGLLGPSFTAATARMGGEAGAGGDEAQARAAALEDVITLELAGPFAWFGLVDVADAPGAPRAVSLTEVGAALASRNAPPAACDPSPAAPALRIDPSGEIALRAPTPSRVWALTAFTEPVDLGLESHYRLTPASVAAALGAGITRDQIVAFLERGSRQPLPPELDTRLTDWTRSKRRAVLRRSVVLALDDAGELELVLQALRDAGWAAEPAGERSLLVLLPDAPTAAASGEKDLIAALRAAGLTPHWGMPSNGEMQRDVFLSGNGERSSMP